MRWRFYRDGLVCFDAVMHNEGGTLDRRGFQASLVDDHPPLKHHFAELCTEQSGAWAYI